MGAEISHAVIGEKRFAYTTERSDISSLVPLSATTVLDLGCSNGSLGSMLKRAKHDRFVWGVEIDHVLAVEAAKELDRVSCLDLEEAITRDTFAGRTFDCVIAADVLEHLRYPENLLGSIDEVLNDEGVLIVSLPNIRHHSVAISIFLKGTFPRRGVEFSTLRISAGLLVPMP